MFLYSGAIFPPTDDFSHLIFCYDNALTGFLTHTHTPIDMDNFRFRICPVTHNVSKHFSKYSKMVKSIVQQDHSNKSRIWQQNSSFYLKFSSSLSPSVGRAFPLTLDNVLSLIPENSLEYLSILTFAKGTSSSSSSSNFLLFSVYLVQLLQVYAALSLYRSI